MGKDTAEMMKTAGELARETLQRAEEKGLTLAEVMLIPEAMTGIIKYGIEQQETPYEYPKPRRKD